MTTIATKYPFVGSIETKQGGRAENQDNAGFVDTPLGLLLVVCDGMGGGPGGRTASLIAVDTILTVISDVSEHTPREDALKYAIDKANDIIYAKAKDTPELRGMGTTVAAILINEDSAVIGHAGDTRIYQLRKGTIVFRSSDHSVVANLVRQKSITEEEARNHPQANIVTRALGIRPNMEIDFDEVPFIRGDRFVICTDGIWGMMPQRDLVKALSCVMGIDELTIALTEKIDRIGHENGGGHDNMTLAVVDTSFDSVLKKIKKNKNADTNLGFNGKEIKDFRNKKLLVLLVVCFLIAGLLLVYLFIKPNEKENLKINEITMEGSTTTTIKHNVVWTEEDDSANQDLSNINRQVNSIPKVNTVNPFQDSTLRDEQNKEIKRQIIYIVKNLDNLKEIKGRSKGKTIEKKIKYVKDVIRPGVHQLGNKVVNEKKKNVKEILLMLNDKKIVSSDWRGRTTPDGNKYIDDIKIKVKKLQD